MKTLHFASILALAAATTFACDDSEDRVETSVAGSSGAAGKNAAAGSNTAGSSETAGTAGAHAGAGNDGGVGGAAAGENQGGSGAGDANGAGAGGTNETDGGAGGMGGAGGEGGAGGTPEVPDVVVPGPTDLVGTWSNNFGGTDVITQNTWNGANIVAYASGVTAVYVHNPKSDPYNPSKFTKYVYTQPVSDSFYYCMIVYNAETLAAAQADTKVADATNPDTSGCSGFSWTKATKP